MYKDLTNEELEKRLTGFKGMMGRLCPDWDTAIFMSKVNQYYFTGTMQDGMLMIRRDGATYFVRRSYERARDESPFSPVIQMDSYRDAAGHMGGECGNTFIEAEIVTVGIMERLKKYFTMAAVNPLDKVIASVRSIKSPYELEWTEKSGKQHEYVLKEAVPAMLREGISEAEFVAALFSEMVKAGHQGINRFSMFQNELSIGQIGFGESSLYPMSFDGPGGGYGMSPSAPLLGSRDRKLKKGDLVFVDIGFGMNGYHTDKTQVYMFGAKPAEEIIQAHRKCIQVQSRTAEMLKPGAIPSEIYSTVTGELDSGFLQNFMGFGNRQAKFLGHGVGLYIDELPVIAKGFNEPIAENMVISLEPKKGISGAGMVGVEDTYIVTAGGAKCVTGGGTDIIAV